MPVCSHILLCLGGQVWEVGSAECAEKCRHTLAGHAAGVTSLGVFGDGLVALSGSFDNTLKVWDVPNQ